AAIPRRVAGVEQEIAQQVQEHNIPEPPTIDPRVAEPASDNAAPQFRWELIDGAQHLFTSSHNAHYALTLPSAYGSWEAMDVLADAAQRLAADHQAALSVVPGHEHLARLQRRLESPVGLRSCAVLSRDQGKPARYRAFLAMLPP